jgi:uncharacterized protein (DUF2235 family)
VFFFGFSRGAYTARATCGLVCRVGISEADQMSQFWEMYAVYKTLGKGQRIQDTDWGMFPPAPEETFTVKVKKEKVTLKKGSGNLWLYHCHTGVNIKVVGVWDTVGSVGWPANVHWDVSEWNKTYDIHDTRLNPPIWTSTVENAFHALALDEHRASFTPTLWTLPSDSEAKKTNLIQCWFPGVHVNVGGGSDDPFKDKMGDFESIANMTFAWMVDRCAPFLSFNYISLAVYCGPVLQSH